MQLKLDYLFYDVPMWLLLAMFIFFFIYCFQPCLSIGYRTARYELGVTIFEIFKAPFGKVRFRDFFFADVITSLSVTLKDIYQSMFYIIHITQTNTQRDFIREKFPSWIWYSFVMSLIPSWFRFAQCLNKRYYSGMNIHFANAGKYFSKLVPPLVVLALPKSKSIGDSNFWLFIFVNVVATMYSFCWDIYMDWGLLRSKASGTYGLRPKIKYHQFFYYYAAFMNLTLRFWWVTAFWFNVNKDDSKIVDENSF